MQELLARESVGQQIANTGARAQLDPDELRPISRARSRREACGRRRGIEQEQ